MMKYWKIIVISLVIVLTVGTFYYQAAKANKLDVAIQLETIKGNEEEIAHLHMNGYYYEGEVGHSFILTKDGATGSSNPSFFETLKNPSGSPIMQNYVKEYKSFMRGKEMNALKFCEDENRLIYVDIKENARQLIQGNPLTLQVSILDKQTDEHSSFEVETKAEATYEWINIDDVYVENGKVKVFVTGYLLNYEGEEVRVFTIDETDKEMVQQLLSSKREEGKTSSMRQLIDTHLLQNVNYSVYKENQYKAQSDNTEDGRELVSERLFIYNNSTDEVKEWSVPEELQQSVDSFVLHESSLILLVPTDTGLELYRYQIEQDEWETPKKIDIANYNDEDAVLFTRQIDGKLFVFNQSTGNTIMVIMDLTTDEVLYEGEITVEKDGKTVSDSEFSIFELYEVES